MNPLAAYVYSNSSVLLDSYKPLGTILVSTRTAEKGNAKTRRAGSGEKAALSLPSPHTFFALVFSICAFPTISELGTG